MFSQFLDGSVPAIDTEYQPKLLETKAEISFFNDVLSDLKVLDEQKKSAIEQSSNNIFASVAL